MDLLITISLILIAGFIFVLFAKQKQHKRYNRSDYYDNQKQRVEVGGYKKQALLNQTEQVAYKAITTAVSDKNLRVFAQVSLGEILTHSHKKLYLDIMSKRVDFLLTDQNFIPIMVIEIHGSGHYSKNAEHRDNIKKIALTSADVDYLAIATSGTQIYQDVYQALIQRIS
ncbi:DUF2726 domain-containing protein [Suttonella ornithocola]|uniref:Protein of uncharacterized function (DUF2726) n=1 Tax=Suttonella ornithocola TaxID=279832 RepID=A0A380MXQ7_9GAMM|nr:DUF2726 domain-containing protein [Suttonella ornithocola]SUO97355.1 Protein of uncharacterised function (DUF2726) [Suttonella ornithocola]